MSKALTKQLYEGLQKKLAVTLAPKKGIGVKAQATKKTTGGARGGGGKTMRRKHLKASKKATDAKTGVEASPESILAKNVRLLKKLGAHRTQQDVLEQVRHVRPSSSSIQLPLFGLTLSSQSLMTSFQVDSVPCSFLPHLHSPHLNAGFEKISLSAEAQ